MIARIWRGAVPGAKTKEYLELLRGAALLSGVAPPGNRGCWCLYCTEDDVTRFERLTFWDDYDAIERFTGDDCALPEYCDFDFEYLIAGEHLVLHYEVRSNAPDASGPKRRTGGGVENEIARIWRGAVPVEKAEAYCFHHRA